MTWDSALASSEALGLAFAGCLLLIARRNRDAVNLVLADRERPWPALRAAGLAALAALLAWGSIFDNWRQLTGVPLRWLQTYDYQRREFDPPSAEVRWVTVALLVLAVAALSLLVARYVGGPGIAAIFAIASVFAWMPLFVVRQRIGIDLALGTNSRSFGDVAGFLVFLGVSWVFDLGLMAASLAALICAAAVPVGFVLNRLGLREQAPVVATTGYFGHFSGPSREDEPARR